MCLGGSSVSLPLPSQMVSLINKKTNPTGPFKTKPAAVTGKLEIRLLGCRNLLEEIPGRSRVKENSTTGVLSGVKSRSKSSLGRTSSKSYSIKDEISNEIMAVIRLDNQSINQTSWKTYGQMAWDQRFTFDLERCKEMEIQIFWHDWRQMCALAFLHLEEFIDDHRRGIALHLEPQGILFAEFKFTNPSIITAKPQLKRQKLFRQKGNNFMRPGSNKNVAAWGRLLKRVLPSTPTTTSAPTSSLVQSPSTESDFRRMSEDVLSPTSDLNSNDRKQSSASLSSDRVHVSDYHIRTPLSQSSSASSISASSSSQPTSSSKTHQSTSIITSAPDSITNLQILTVNEPIIKEPSPEVQPTPGRHFSNISIDEATSYMEALNLKSNEPEQQPIIEIPDEVTSPKSIGKSSAHSSISSEQRSRPQTPPPLPAKGPPMVPPIPAKRTTTTHLKEKLASANGGEQQIGITDFELIAVLGRGHFGKVCLVSKYFAKYITITF